MHNIIQNILDKDINKVTPDDLSIIMRYIHNNSKDHSWKSMFLLSDDKISIYVNGIYGFESPNIYLDNNGFSVEHKICKKTGNKIHYNRHVSIFVYDFISLGLDSINQVHKVIKTIFNMYRVFKLNPNKINSVVREYPSVWLSTVDDFWEEMSKYLIKYKQYDAIKETNFDHSKMTKETINLLKSHKGINKYKL